MDSSKISVVALVLALVCISVNFSLVNAVGGGVLPVAPQVVHKSTPLKHKAPPPPQVIREKKVVATPAKFVCPAGYELKNQNECVIQIMKQPIVSCPPGFEKRPTGGHKVDDFVCEHRSVKSPLSMCPKGYERVEGGCAKNVAEPAQPYCPAGFQPDIDTTLPAPGVGTQCKRDIIVKPSTVCTDDDYVMKDDRCERQIIVQSSEYCPGDTKYDSKTQQCVHMEVERAVAVCPLGTVPLDNRTCVGERKMDAELRCPPGYEALLASELKNVGLQRGNNDEELGYRNPLQSGRLRQSSEFGDPEIVCVKEMSMRLPKTCEGDAKMNADGDCVVQALLPAEYKCDDGFEVNERLGICERKETRPLRPVCPNGSPVDSSGECRVSEALLPGVTCPLGYVEVPGGGSMFQICYNRDVRKAKNVCPDGYELSQNKRICVRPYEKNPSPRCPEGFIFAAPGEAEQDGMGVCLKPTFHHVLQKCPEGYHLLAGRCVTSVSMSPSLVCPIQFELEGAQCVQVQRTNMLWRCSGGEYEMLGDKCIKPVLQPPRTSCSKGFRFNAMKGVCEDVRKAPLQVRCPKGLQLEDVEKSGGGNNPGKMPRPSHQQCISQKVERPTPTCPPGHMYNSTTQQCEKQVIHTVVQPTSKGSYYQNQSSSHHYTHWR